MIPVPDRPVDFWGWRRLHVVDMTLKAMHIRFVPSCASLLLAIWITGIAAFRTLRSQHVVRMLDVSRDGVSFLQAPGGASGSNKHTKSYRVLRPASPTGGHRAFSDHSGNEKLWTL